MSRAATRPLEDDWRVLLDSIADAAKLPRALPELGRLLEALSQTYNVGQNFAAQQQLLAPRLLFSLPRDLQKGAGAVRELVATGALGFGDRPLRILDLGAGLGAATVGVVRALERHGARGAVEATLVDHDASALQLARHVLDGATRRGLLASTITTTTQTAPLDGKLPPGPFDLVLACQVLCELDSNAPEATRADKLAARAATWLERLEPHGSLVLIEPALRERTRILHRVRDALLATKRATLFAPCLHAQPCPALAQEGDWCHEDLDVDLPSWLIPLAQRAGLRWQGLTFSYLVVRRDGQSLATLRPAATLRVVSDARPQKGKCERFLCGRFADAQTRQRVILLDRHARPDNAALRESPRGSLLTVEPAPRAETPRLAPETIVKVLDEP